MSDAPFPQLFTWDGQAMVPLNARLADRQFVVGETYRLAVREDRSDASHRQFFAVIADAWANLPDRFAGQFLNPEHLRKYLLIKAGFCDKEIVLTASESEAKRVAPYFRPRNDYALVVIDGQMIERYWAKSMSERSMDRQTFQRAKQDCFEIAADMLGISVSELTQQGGQAA